MHLNSLQLTLLLVAVFQIKHFLADYPLQTPYMLRKFRPDWGFLAPLAAHAGVHAAFTFTIATVVLVAHEYRPAVGLANAAILAGFDFAVHFTMDRIKASPRLMGRWKSLSPGEYMQHKEMAESTYPGIEAAKALSRKALRGNTLFWWALGFDQMVHHFTDLAVATVIGLLATY